MTEDDLPEDDEPSALEQALEEQLHLAELDQAELEQVAVAIHRVMCRLSPCPHAIVDVAAVDVERARAAIHVMRRLETRPRWRQQGGDPSGA